MKNEGELQLPKRKRNKDDGELDITPMIDITFLLLAFFVVSSKMDPQKDIPLPFASYGEAVSDQASVTLLVTLKEGSTEEYEIFKGKSDANPVTATDPDEQEEEISEFVDKQLSANPEKTTILIKASGDVKTGVVEMCRRAVGNAELFGERKIYVGVKEQQ